MKGDRSMKFRPCIDIHNGSVKQIVGGSLKDDNNQADNNFVSEYDASYYAKMYKHDGYSGGHIIILNPEGSEYYEKDLEQAKLALSAYPNAMQIGGGININNAEKFLDMGATHVIVTSYVFCNGMIDYERLKSLSALIGKEHLVLDLSCRFAGDNYYVVTDRWQNLTDEVFSNELLEHLYEYCDEFLVHAVDVEGKASGVEEDVIKILGNVKDIPVTYAGGIHNTEDISIIKTLGNNMVDFTIGSALDIFGGKIKYGDLSKIISM